jgi:hypothetical protein
MSLLITLIQDAELGNKKSDVMVAVKTFVEHR